MKHLYSQPFSSLLISTGVLLSVNVDQKNVHFVLKTFHETMVRKVHNIDISKSWSLLSWEQGTICPLWLTVSLTSKLFRFSQRELAGQLCTDAWTKYCKIYTKQSARLNACMCIATTRRVVFVENFTCCWYMWPSARCEGYTWPVWTATSTWKCFLKYEWSRAAVSLASLIFQKTFPGAGSS